MRIISLRQRLLQRGVLPIDLLGYSTDGFLNKGPTEGSEATTLKAAIKKRQPLSFTTTPSRLLNQAKSRLRDSS